MGMGYFIKLQQIIHLLRTVPFCILHSFLEQFDSNLKSCLSHIIQCSLPNDSWCQATSPFRLGGLGLRSSFSSAAAAFLGSCNSVRLLASHLLSQDFHDLVFPNEEHAVVPLKGLHLISLFPLLPSRLTGSVRSKSV